MKENDEEKHVRQTLEYHGFDVERVGEDVVDRRADYEFRKNGDHYILEVTAKKETQFVLDLIREAGRCGVATGDRKIDYWNRADALVKDKVRQLVSTPGRADSFRVLWLCALHHDGVSVTDLVRRTVYGIRYLGIFRQGNPLGFRDCFYYNYNSFFSVPELDGLVLENTKGYLLCINEFSPRVERFRLCALARVFREKCPESIYDPVALDKEGRALRIEGNVNRHDDKAKWKYLLDKYGLQTCPSFESEFVGFAIVNGSTDSQ
jgi:hypothetical protein